MRLRKFFIIAPIVGIILLFMMQGCSSSQFKEQEGSNRLRPMNPALESSSNETPTTVGFAGASFRSDMVAIPTESEIVTDLDSIHLPKGDKKSEVMPVVSPVAAPAIRAEQVPIVKNEIVKSEKPVSRQRNGSMMYKVRKNDTLMKIAFQAFADPLRWKEIYEDNKAKVKGLQKLTIGDTFLVRVANFANITRNGLPYFINRNDTLAKIANKVYGIAERWPHIWKNNPELIRDPNLIYAGFTLYYTEKDK